MKINNPSKEYEQTRTAILQNTDSVLSDLLKRSGVSLDTNRKLVSHYHHCVDDAADLKDNIFRLKYKIWLYVLTSIFLSIICFVFAYYGIQGISQRTLRSFMILPGMALCIAVIFPIRKIKFELSPALSDKNILMEELEKQTLNAKNACKDSIAPFLNQLYDGLTFKIIEMTLEGMDIEPFLTDYHIESMKQYSPDAPDFREKNLDQSTLEVVSGELYRNPFILRKYLKHHLGTVTYSGSRVIEIECYEKGKHGVRVLKTESETLTGYVTAPMPYYNSDISFAMACSEVSDLCFSRKAMPGKINIQKSRRRIIKRRLAELYRLYRKNLRSTDIENIITPMANEEFEGLFAAFDRNNDMGFRTMFTSDAQKNIVELIDDPRFGDYFDFTKTVGITYIKTSDKSWEMDSCISRFLDMLDYDEIVSQLKDNVLSYFDNFYKFLAPIFCIPIYKTHTSPYNSHIASEGRTSEYIAEVLANKIGSEKILGIKTNAIITTSEKARKGYIDSYYLDVFFYEELPRVTTTSVTASDGKQYDVDVKWVEYIPNHRNLVLNICLPDLMKDSHDLLPQVTDRLQDHNCPYIYKQGLFAWIEDPDDLLPEYTVASLFRT